MSLCLLCMCEKVYLSESIVDWHSAYDAREAVCGCACDCMFVTSWLWCVFRCARYDISVLNQSFVCVQHNRLSVSLPHFPTGISLKFSLSLLSLLSVLLCLLSAAAAFCVKSTRHLAEVGITPLLSLYTNREDTF